MQKSIYVLKNKNKQGLSRAKLSTAGVKSCLVKLELQFWLDSIKFVYMKANLDKKLNQNLLSQTIHLLDFGPSLMS